MKLTGIVFAILWIGVAAKAAGARDACASNPRSNLQSAKLLQTEIVPSPYDFACRKGIRKNEMPSTFQRTYPRKDSQGNDSHEFLRLVAEKAQKLLVVNQKTNERMLACVDAKTGKAICEEKAIAHIQEMAATARADHSLDQALQAALIPAKEFIPSSATDYDGFGKATKWAKYSQDEMEMATSLRKDYIAQAKKQLALQKQLDQKRAPEDRVVGPNEERFQNEILENIRMGHEQKYNIRMANYPVLQYVSSENPSPTEIRKSFEKLESNRKAQQEKLKSFAAELKPQAKEVDRDLLWVLKYRVLVEHTLLEHPEYCTVAAGITQFDENVQRVNRTAVGLGLVVGTVVMPYAVGLGLAGTEAVAMAGVSRAVTMGAYSVSSLYWAKDPLLNYMELGQAARVGGKGEDALQGQQTVSQAQDDFKNTLYLGIPIGVAVTKSTQATIQIAAKILKAKR